MTWATDLPLSLMSWSFAWSKQFHYPRSPSHISNRGKTFTKGWNSQTHLAIEALRPQQDPQNEGNTSACGYLSTKHSHDRQGKNQVYMACWNGSCYQVPPLGETAPTTKKATRDGALTLHLRQLFLAAFSTSQFSWLDPAKDRRPQGPWNLTGPSHTRFDSNKVAPNTRACFRWQLWQPHPFWNMVQHDPNHCSECSESSNTWVCLKTWHTETDSF
jgi:hypothetical protein